MGNFHFIYVRKCVGNFCIHHFFQLRKPEETPVVGGLVPGSRRPSRLLGPEAQVGRQSSTDAIPPSPPRISPRPPVPGRPPVRSRRRATPVDIRQVAPEPQTEGQVLAGSVPARARGSPAETHGLIRRVPPEGPRTSSCFVTSSVGSHTFDGHSGLDHPTRRNPHSPPVSSSCTSLRVVFLCP